MLIQIRCDLRNISVQRNFFGLRIEVNGEWEAGDVKRFCIKYYGMEEFLIGKRTEYRMELSDSHPDQMHILYEFISVMKYVRSYAKIEHVPCCLLPTCRLT